MRWDALIAAGWACVILGEGFFFQWDYLEMLGGDPILVLLLAAALALTVLVFVRPRPGLFLAAGIVVSLVPIIVLFVFGAVLELADIDDVGNVLGILAFLAAIGLALPAGIQAFRKGRRAA